MAKLKQAAQEIPTLSVGDIIITKPNSIIVGDNPDIQAANKEYLVINISNLEVAPGAGPWIWCIYDSRTHICIWDMNKIKEYFFNPGSFHWQKIRISNARILKVEKNYRSFFLKTIESFNKNERYMDLE